MHGIFYTVVPRRRETHNIMDTLCSLTHARVNNPEVPECSYNTWNPHGWFQIHSILHVQEQESKFPNPENGKLADSAPEWIKTFEQFAWIQWIQWSWRAQL